jgi:hypothetical protein
MPIWDALLSNSASWSAGGWHPRDRASGHRFLPSAATSVALPLRLVRILLTVRERVRMASKRNM